MKRSLAEEIQDLERRLSMYEDDDMLEDELVEEDFEDVEDDFDDDDFEDDFEDEDFEEDSLEEEIAAMMYRLSSSGDEEIEQEAEKIKKEEIEDIEESFSEDVPEVKEEGQNEKMSKQKRLARRLLQLAKEIDNPTEDDGLMQQDFDEVQKVTNNELEEGTDSGEDGDVLPVVQQNTKVNEGDMIQASRLKEASVRLDRVAEELERRGGNWKKYAFRIDQLADAIDSKRKATVNRIAKELLSND